MFPDIQTLTVGLTSVFRGNGYTGDGVTVLDRHPNPYTASCLSEIVTCQFDNGNRMRMFCKGGSRHGASNPTRDKLSNLFHHSNLYGGVLYEAEVYSQILQPLRFASLKFYGVHTDISVGQAWLILEYLSEGVQLHEAPSQMDAFGLAARWIGRFHTVTQMHLTDTVKHSLDSLDSTYYLHYARRTLLALAQVPGPYQWLQQICRGYEQALDVLLTQPRTVIHGDYFCDNILYHGGLVYPIDWACAAIGVGEMDLAMLTYDWPPDISRHCETEYQQARWPDGAPPDFEKRVDIARLCLCFRSLWENTNLVSNNWPAARLDMLRSLSQRLGLFETS
jgi:hypothetical protein